MRIYATGRTAPTPALNALATLTLALTVVIALVGFLLWRAVRGRAVTVGRRSASSPRSTPRRFASSSLAERQDLGGGGFAGAGSALHVHVPEAGDVGAGPVDRPDRAAHVRPEARQPADPERRGVRAASPLLGGPVRLDQIRRAKPLRADERRHALEDRGTPRIRAHPRDEVGLLAGKESAENADGGRRGVLS